jgi:DNA-binding transcriptional MerR regulator
MKLLTQKDVSKQLGIPYYRLEYLHKTGRIPEAKKTSSGIRIYEEEDINKIKKILNRKERLIAGR